jgi:hypothetical protein
MGECGGSRSRELGLGWECSTRGCRGEQSFSCASESSGREPAGSRGKLYQKKGGAQSSRRRKRRRYTFLERVRRSIFILDDISRYLNICI